MLAGSGAAGAPTNSTLTTTWSPSGVEIAGLEAACFDADATGPPWVDGGRAGPFGAARCDGGQGKLDYVNRLRLRWRPGSCADAEARGGDGHTDGRKKTTRTAHL
jgi:hypothetical protein